MGGKLRWGAKELAAAAITPVTTTALRCQCWILLQEASEACLLSQGAACVADFIGRGCQCLNACLAGRMGVGALTMLLLKTRTLATAFACQ